MAATRRHSANAISMRTWVEYLIGAAQEIPWKQLLKIVVTISEEPEPRLVADIIAEAVREHFVHERVQIRRRLGEHVRRGRKFLSIGLAMLVVFLTLAELTSSMPSGPLRGTFPAKSS